MDFVSLVANHLGLQREVNDFLVTANNSGFLGVLSVVADTWFKVCLLRGAIWDRIAGRHRDIIYLSVGIILILAMIVDLLLVIYQTFGWLIQYSVMAGITPIVLVTGALSYKISQSIDFTSYPRVWTIICIFLKIIGSLALESLIVVACVIRISDLIEYLITNYYWCVVVMQIAATLWIYPLPRSGSTLIDSVFSFVVLNQTLLVINFVLQFGAFYVDWLAYRVYEHPPIALGVTCLISLITGVYLFAAGLTVKFGEPLITFILLIGFSRLAMNILSWVFFAILSKTPWVVMEIGLLSIVIALVVVLLKLPPIQIRIVPQTRQTVDWVTFLSRQNIPGIINNMSTGSTAVPVADDATQANIERNDGAGQEGTGTEATFEHGSDVEEMEEGMDEGEENGEEGEEGDEEEEGEEGEEEEGIIVELDQFNHPDGGDSNDLEILARIEERGDHDGEENGQLPIERRLHDTSTTLDDGDEGQGRLNSNQTESNSIKCCVCQHRTKSAVTFPCRHICMCEICAREKLAEHGVCPSCQVPIESIDNLDLQDDLDRVEVTRSQLMCVVCYQNVKSTLLIPCRHLHTCGSCAKTLCEQKKGCPVCRSRIDLAIFVHEFC